MTQPQVPHNIEAEQALLGSLLIDPEAVLRVATFLRPEDFYVRKNGWVYEAILALHERREPVDFVTLRKELEARGLLEEVGGVGYIARLMDAVPTAIHAEAYARIVEEMSTRRRIIAFATSAAKAAYQQSDIDAVLKDVETGAFSLRRSSAGMPVPVARVVNDVYDALASANGRPIGISTGFPDLDALLGGFRPGSLNIVGARTGMGKSSLLLHFGLAALGAGVPVLVFSLEMSADEIVQRLLTMETGIPTMRIQCARISSPDDWSLITEAAGQIAELRMWIDDHPTLRMSEVQSRARRLAAEQGVGLVLFDYVQLGQPDTRQESRYLAVGEVTRSLKALAMELRIPVIAASQISRAVEARADKRPTLADLRESGNQEQDSDVVLFIHRPEENGTTGPQAVEIVVAKNRHGPTGTVKLLWLPDRMRFVSVVKEENV